MRSIVYGLLMTGLLSGGGRGADAGPDVDAVTDVGAPSEAIRSAVVPDDSKPTDVMAEAKAAASPVPVPPLTHYAALWQRSMFTTHDLPMPEVPQGPGFADQLVLAGTYEVDGAVVAVILDKMTAQVTEARIGSDNELGMRIKSVEPGSEGAVKRVQLQKGMQSGWIQVAEVVAAGPAGDAGGVNAAGGQPPPLVPGAMGGAMNDGMRGGGAPMNLGNGGGGSPVVQPLPVPGGAATPNPSLDDIPLPPQ
jgi:hypothetical protein